MSDVSDGGTVGDRSEVTETAGVGSEPLWVLFVCTANICRSAYAEVTARHLVGAWANVEFSSAGTHGLSAQPLNPEMAAHLPEGIAYDDFASRKVTGELIENADVVLAMQASHRAHLIEQDPRAFRRVFTLGQFAEAAGRSDLRGRELISAVGVQRPPSRPEHDVRDPFRRGPVANAEAAARIKELLSIVVPALTAGPAAG